MTKAAEIVLHPIPSADSKPYIIVLGPDRHLWFCESGTSKIGRMAPDGRVIGEYTIPGENCGARAIIAIPDGRLFFSAHDAGAIGEVIPRA